jgi:hypothetical protein
LALVNNHIFYTGREKSDAQKRHRKVGNLKRKQNFKRNNYRRNNYKPFSGKREWHTQTTEICRKQKNAVEYKSHSFLE